MNTKGFSLIEVMIAMVILAIGFAALIQSSTYSIGVRHGSSSRASAVYVAASYLEEIKMWPDSVIVSEPATPVSMDGIVDVFGPFTRTVVIDRTIAPELIKATVTVEYPWALGNRHSVEVHTFVFKGEL
jgi:prepilin-type N-terminal cleavage/methylation domain-containing protein